jgi:agmatine/peptidylarginine deiminase
MQQIIFRFILCLIPTCLVMSLLGGQDPQAQSKNWIDYNQELRQYLPNFFNPQNSPTEPVPLTRAYAEWEPTQCLLLGIPLKATMWKPAVFSYYLNLIEIASQYVDVAILFGNQDTREQDRFIKRLQERGLSESSFERIHFVEMQTGDHWIRDYGPLFGKSPQGGLVAFDNSYRSLMDEQESWTLAPTDILSADLVNDIAGFEAYKRHNRQVEVAPNYIAKFIRQDLQIDCEVVRPPLFLQGGDYITDGNGRFFISEDTILSNGGNLRNVQAIFRDYYGAREILIMNSLPGITAKHLDMLVKLVDPRTFIFSEAPEQKPGYNKFNRRIAQEIALIQAGNRSYLDRNTSDFKVLTVPMLPLLEEDLEIVLARTRAQIFAMVCEEVGVSYLKYFQLPPQDEGKLKIAKKVGEYLDEQFQRTIEFNRHTDLDLLARTYLNADLQTLIDTDSGSKTIYRSYVNSLYLKNASGRSVWILPSYAARKGEDEKTMIETEKIVESVYREASPDTEIHWLNSDAMVDTLGAIHCSTLTIPVASLPNKALSN